MSLKQSEILDFIKSARAPVTKREVARAFGIKGGENRVALKQILKTLEKEGEITKQAGGAYSVPEGLPAVGIIEVSEIDIDGDVFARLIKWDETVQGTQPRIEIMPDRRGHPALEVGDRVLARFTRISADEYEARTIRRLDTEAGRVIGLLRLQKHGAVLQPADKKAKYNFEVVDDFKGAKDGDLVIGEIQLEKRARNKKVRIVQILGARDDPKAISLISAHEVGLRQEFPATAVKETENQKVPSLKGRKDLRQIPLVTIDGADARDFDDAVFAESTKDGFHIIVAIADVSYYVRPGSALDDEAQARGNSTYFPDRVIPMLPEALSNDLCSLRPDEDRACLAAHLWIDRKGHLKKYEFVRGLMRSHARLTYEEVQAFRDNGSEMANDKKRDLSHLSSVISPLYNAYHILDKARRERGALEIELPEKKILLDENNTMTGVTTRERLDAHKLIEEFMILANVAAARALEDKNVPCVYRVHDRPGMDKLESAREFLDGFGLSLPKTAKVQPRQLNGLLSKACKKHYAPLINTVILRTQSQAVYSPENIGHFGLGLEKYAHFTSPIRRYADLLVHRALIKAYGLGSGGLPDDQAARLTPICQSISEAERRSMEAERNATDRFTAAYLSEHVGASFSGTISGVTRFGLFVTLDESGADGLVPMKSMSNDFYVHDEKAHALVGRRTGKVYRLGAKVTVRLAEADGLTGSTILELTGKSVKGADIPEFNGPKPKSGTQRKNRKPRKRKRNRTKKKQ